MNRRTSESRRPSLRLVARCNAKQCGAWRLAMFWLIVVMLTACQAPESDPPPRIYPKISQLPSPTVRPPGQAPFGPVRLYAYLTRLELPLKASTDAAWALADTSELSPVMLRVWETNGLRVGRLDIEQLASFEKALPEIVHAPSSRLISRYDQPYPIYASPPMRQAVLVDLTAPPLAIKEATIRKGRCQLLADLLRGPDGVEAMNLTLHHHRAKPSILPRSAAQQALDGRLFEELMLRAPLQPQRLVVVGLRRTDQTASPPTQEGENVNQDQGAANPPRRFGDQLLTGRRLGRDVQVMLILRIDLLESGQTPPQP